MGTTQSRSMASFTKQNGTKIGEATFMQKGDAGYSATGSQMAFAFKESAREMQRLVLAGPPNDPDETLKIMDGVAVHMSVGMDKQDFIDNLLVQKAPMVCVELGAYAGYSAVATARRLQPGAHIYSIEFDPEYAEISRSVIEHCGLGHRVTTLVGSATEVLPTLQKDLGVQNIDFLFIDHDKNYYVSDLCICKELKLLRSGSMVIADNVLFPGCPEYIEHMEHNKGTYQTMMQRGFKCGVASNEDALMVSEVLPSVA